MAPWPTIIVDDFHFNEKRAAICKTIREQITCERIDVQQRNDKEQIRKAETSAGSGRRYCMHDKRFRFAKSENSACFQRHSCSAWRGANYGVYFQALDSVAVPRQQKSNSLQKT